jgi:hypothetical protein
LAKTEKCNCIVMVKGERKKLFISKIKCRELGGYCARKNCELCEDPD